jgi:hypothetical protein
MANVVAVVKDDRVRRQIEQFLNDLGMDDLRYATFATVEEFYAKYFRDKPKAPPPPPPTGALPPTGTEGTAAAGGAEPATAPAPVEDRPPDVEDFKVFDQLHVIIFALDTIGEKPSPWIDKIKLNLKRYRKWPETNQLRMLMLKYEEDGINKVDLLHPSLDDIIFIPLDRLVFLQKMQIFLGLPKIVKPSFLFNQEVKSEIEISKLAKLDRLSDVGLAIRNPVPLKKGLPGHFYITLPGEKNKIEIRAKVLRSDPHPEIPGQFLVYFSYFGIPKATLTLIRKVLSKSARYTSLLRDDREAFRFKPNDPFLTPEQAKVFGVAVIDLDENLARGLAQSLTKDMDRLKVISESSYSLFLHKYFEPSAQSGSSDIPSPTEDEDLYKQPVILTLNVSDMKMAGVLPTPNQGDKFLGHDALEIFSKPERWLDLMSEKASRLLMEEAIQLVLKGRPSEKLLILTDAAGERRALNFRFAKGPNEQMVIASLTPASMSDIVTKLNSEERNKNLEVLIVDSNFVPADPMAWLDGMKSRAVNVGLIQNPSQLKFFVLAETEAQISPNWINVPDILGVSLKPVDNRQLIFLLSEALGNRNTIYHFDNLGWAQPNLSIHVAKDIMLEALSEFGATLKSAHKLVPGSVIYLRKSIFENAPSQCLSARVYHCEDHTDKGFYRVLSTYFGINDSFLKFARTWIRENYANLKSHDNG